MGVILQNKLLPAYSKHGIPLFQAYKGVSVINGPHVRARTWVEGTTDHAWEDDEDEGQHLQIGSQEGCSLHVTHVLSRQRSLHNHLHEEERRRENKATILGFRHISSLPLPPSQLFSSARSPGRHGQTKGAKVVIAKPGSFHRPAQASGPVIGGHRYWRANSPQMRSETRSGRSPRRHSPGYRNAEHASPQQPGNTSGLLGISLSKVGNLKYLKARGGTPQKRASQNTKGAR